MLPDLGACVFTVKRPCTPKNLQLCMVRMHTMIEGSQSLLFAQ